MSIAILNCLEIRPYLTWVNGGVTCLLIETNHGPVLVDTGIGIQDHWQPTQRMHWYKLLYRTSRNIEQTAFQQVQRLGYKPEDVQHIILSHAHLDHAGGLADFPWATVHILQRELDNIQKKPNWKYIPAHWAHKPKWKAHHTKDEKWFGFEALQLTGFSPEIWLIPLQGHTPGLAGVAIRNEDTWLLYGSDALPYNARVDLVPRWFARFFMYHHAPRIQHLIEKNPEIQLVSGHMTLEFYKNKE